MKFAKKWMVVPYVEQKVENEEFLKLEKIIQSPNINDEEKLSSYNNQFKKIINTQNPKVQIEDDRIEKLKNEFEQLDKKRQEEISLLQQSINSINGNIDSDSFFKPTYKSTRNSKKRRINADESLILSSRYNKHLQKAPHKVNFGTKAKFNQHPKWVHDDIQDLSNEISMININE